MRNFGDPIPHMPPIPSIPDVVDDFYHVGYGSAIVKQLFWDFFVIFGRSQKFLEKVPKA